ncbi:hypothetical protein GX50_08795 [[Emmonsia] crescens]|uniref:Uncharacterized protein n=1 Tax=[Emmonsia] crescens TaxID=73230 RepID=A0A2B7Z4F0_9EURO|nr:hypothetical protein GX50_08795 [Emmonsia crescens]
MSITIKKSEKLISLNSLNHSSNLSICNKPSQKPKISIATQSI